MAGILLYSVILGKNPISPPFTSGQFQYPSQPNPCVLYQINSNLTQKSVSLGLSALELRIVLSDESQMTGMSTYVQLHISALMCSTQLCVVKAPHHGPALVEPIVNYT
jgi:hypothetical protein